MKIAVCGAGSETDPEISKKVEELGIILAKNNVLVLTGGCHGYPGDAAKSAYQGGGTVVGISPAKDQAEHDAVYKFPNDIFTSIEFTGMGIPARNYALVSQADAVIIVGGQTGTLNEFTIAFHFKKPIGVLKNSGGITDVLDGIAGLCNKTNEKENVLFSEDPEELVSLVLERHSNANH